nr:MAG: replication associated protein [Cressdnaviricota sp.]
MKQTQMETMDRSVLGNTIAKTRISQLKRWAFTWNNYEESDFKSLIEKLDRMETKYCIGEEIGESGTPHLQGYIELNKPMRWTELNLSKKIHWEGCKGTQEQNIKYCTKDNKYKTNLKIKKPLKVLKEEQLYNWEKDIIKIIEAEPDDRKIYWYWEEKGAVGKTTFCKYLSAKYGAVPVEGKKNDILYCASEFESEIYLFDLERSMEDYVSYGAIEKIKNGYYMCSKYESKPVIRNPPHIIIFANFPPDESQLSADRWVIRIL